MLVKHLLIEEKRMRIALVLLAIILSPVTGSFAANTAKFEFLNSGKVMPTDLPFSEGVRVGGTLYLSGQIGVPPGSYELVAGGIKEEARQTMENIRMSLEVHG
jgi:2-iminobutanoate/2-iminopropanoate deaminase